MYDDVTKRPRCRLYGLNMTCCVGYWCVAVSVRVDLKFSKVSALVYFPYRRSLVGTFAGRNLQISAGRNLQFLPLSVWEDRVLLPGPA